MIFLIDCMRVLSRDTVSTSAIFVGATSGEASIPVIVGILMGEENYMALPYSILCFLCVCIGIYMVAHYLGVSGHYAYLF